MSAVLAGFRIGARGSYARVGDVVADEHGVEREVIDFDEGDVYPFDVRDERWFLRSVDEGRESSVAFQRMHDYYVITKDGEQR